MELPRVWDGGGGTFLLQCGHQPCNLHLQEGLVPEGMVTRRTLNWALGILLSRVIMLQDKVWG